MWFWLYWQRCFRWRACNESNRQASLKGNNVDRDHQRSEDLCREPARTGRRDTRARWRFSRSEERRVGKSVDLGGRRIIKKKKDSSRWLGSARGYVPST